MNKNSIMQSLKKEAMKRNADISFIINLFVLERMAHRLSLSEKTARFLIFKGGLVSLLVYQSNRFTVDLDALVQGFDITKAEEVVVPVVVDDIGDGVWFMYHGKKQLAGQTDYVGLQLVFRGGIGSVPKKYERAQKYHVDLGVGDAVYPEARKVETPSISQEHTPLSWSVYPIETIISEKLHAVINLGSGNSRSKDIYDLSLLLPKADPALLPESLKRTFANRKTILPLDLMDTLKNIDLQMIRRGWPSATASIANAPTLDETWDIITQKVEELL